MFYLDKKMNNLSRLLALLFLVFFNISNLESGWKNWNINRNKQRESILKEEWRMLNNEHIVLPKLIELDKAVQRDRLEIIRDIIFTLTPEEDVLINEDLDHLDIKIREKVNQRLKGISFNAKKALFNLMSAQLVDEDILGACCACFELAVADEDFVFFRTSCNHYFCEDCFLKLILYSRFTKNIKVSCPACRFDLLKKSDT
jgi:hypothetical protein